MSRSHKPVAWLHGEIKSPPFSERARVETGVLLRALQAGESIGLPASRPMPSIGPRCHELRVVDEDVSWRIVYRIDHDAVAIVGVFTKRTQVTPVHVIAACKRRLAAYDRSGGGR